MNLLIPLGLLGLLSIVALILIYIIKPNYQQKLVSSTYVWKLSLKYKRKQIPISKLRNIILIICQIVILVACAMILAKPVVTTPVRENATEVIIILDSSASMRTVDENNLSRYEKAVRTIKDQANDVFSQNGYVSVIIAEKESSYLLQRCASANRLTLQQALDELIEGDDLACTYGESDIENAVLLSESVLNINRNAQIYLYTDNSYDYVPEDIALINMGSNKEYNVGILGVTVEQDEETRCFFTVEVANYGTVDRTVDLTLNFTEVNAIYGAVADDDIKGEDISISCSVDCPIDVPQKVIFINQSTYETFDVAKFENTKFCIFEDNMVSEPIFNYGSIRAAITGGDSFSYDDVFYVYGGHRPALRVQYASTEPNPFFNSALSSIQKYYRQTGLYDLRITTVRKGGTYQLAGFDFYIFEGQVPKTLPMDGVVFLIDPIMSNQSQNPGFTINRIVDHGNWETSSEKLTEEASHPFLKDIVASSLAVTRYYAINYFDDTYQVLLRFADTNLPALLLKDDEADRASKVIVMPFSVHYSNLVLSGGQFPLLLLNMFDYFFPGTVVGNAFMVGDTIALNARGEQLKIEGYGVEETFTDFPSAITLNTPGTYTLSQTTDFDLDIEEVLFVRMPASESNIFGHESAIESPIRPDVVDAPYYDLLLILAAILVGFLFIEWWLQSRANNI